MQRAWCTVSSSPMGIGGSRFAKDFDRTAAWLAFNLFSKAVEEYFRIDWETEAERIYSSNMTLAVSSADSAFFEALPILRVVFKVCLQ